MKDVNKPMSRKGVVQHFVQNKPSRRISIFCVAQRCYEGDLNDFERLRLLAHSMALVPRATYNKRQTLLVQLPPCHVCPWLRLTICRATKPSSTALVRPPPRHPAGRPGRLAISHTVTKRCGRHCLRLRHRSYHTAAAASRTSPQRRSRHRRSQSALKL